MQYEQSTYYNQEFVRFIESNPQFCYEESFTTLSNQTAQKIGVFCSGLE